MSLTVIRRYLRNGRRLIATWRAVVDTLARDDGLSPSRMVPSGKSLKGRMASILIIADTAFDWIAGVVPA